MMMLDNKVEEIYPEQIIDKELVIKLKEKLNLPVYVIEPLICKYKQEKSSPSNLEEMRQFVNQKIVNPQNNSKIQAEIREKGSQKLVDKVTAKAAAGEDKYWAQLVKLDANKVKISSQLINDYPQLLEEGLWAEINLNYLGSTGVKESEFEIEELTPYQQTNFNLKEFKQKAGEFTRYQWVSLLLRSVGIEPSNFSERKRLLLISRLIPFVEKNYNFVELGSRNTGKSYTYRQLSQKSILVSGGKTTVANLFYNMGTNEMGLVGKRDVVAFDEVAYIDFKDKTAVQILKDYMEAGAFSRGKEEISAEASMVFLGNVNQSIRVLLHESNLFAPLPDLMKDMALIDRFHFYLPGWELDKFKENDFTEHYGLQNSYLALALNRLRELDFTDVVEEYFYLDEKMDVRDRRAVKKTVAGYIKLLHPDGNFEREDIRTYLDLALEGRKRVKTQLARMGNFEYKDINFEYTDSSSGEKYYPMLPEEEINRGFKRRLADPGVIYIGELISEQEFGLVELKVTCEAGKGELFFKGQIDQTIKQRLRRTFLFLIDEHSNSDIQEKLKVNNFYVSLNPILKKVKADISNPFLIALYSLLRNKSVPHGLLVTENSSLYRKPENKKKLRILQVKGDGKRVKTLLPLKDGVFIEVPKMITEKAPVFIEV